MCDHLGPGYKCRNTLGFFRCDKINTPSPSSTTETSSTTTCDSCSLSTPTITFRCPRGYYANAQRRCIGRDDVPTFLIKKRGHGTEGALAHLVNEVSQALDESQATAGDADPLLSSILSVLMGHWPVRGSYKKNKGEYRYNIDECEKGGVCKPNQVCMNIPGGYICSNKMNCEAGFRLNQDTNRCMDIDECVEQPGVCDHNCHNTWGSFRCSCRSGYTLFQDNRTCVDINECEMFKDRRLCIGYCVNQPGSFSCQCPQGYRLGIDGASCQDIDECSSQNVCTGRNELCLNMRGAYRCVSTACPQDYIKDSQHANRCKRITMSCREGDMECLQKPLTYTFHFITLVSNLTRSNGPLDLFMMRGPVWSSTNVQFDLRLDKVHTTPSVKAASLQSFQLEEADHNVANIRLLQPLIGPQDIYLQLFMKFFYNGIYGGTTISNIAIFVSQYEF
ncbi:hypothetical protein J6590_062807 [Homalodisca vitripennis]|nr:hypothetical protein J6590_062807 [Homalodisca vitripennis]